MNQLLKLRIKHNLTQEELADKSNVSVRTIQRIENGTQPKGYTLRALAKALEINESELLTNQQEEIKINTQLLKFINLSSLPFIILPPLNIIAPVLLTYYKKQNNPTTKQIASIQFLWTILSIIIFLLCIFIKKWLDLDNMVVLMTMTVLIISDIYIILRNAVEIDKNNSLYIRLKFSLL